MQLHRLSAYQLPPRGFWSWWCSGFSVLDSLLVFAFAFTMTW